MKKRILLFALTVFVLQNTFAWGWAVRDVSKQSSENPAYYLGDQVTLYWQINSTAWGAVLKKAGIGTTNASANLNWQNIVWDNDAGDGSGNNEGIRSSVFTATSVGTWYYSLWIGFNNTSVGDNGHWYNGSSTWNEGFGTFTSSTFSVSALSDPTSPAASAASITQLNLSWTKWNSKNVMIVRRLSSAAPSTAPTQGTAYTVGNTLGTGTVVYNSGGTSFNDTGLTPGTAYVYTLYSENYSYYSTGVTASATTTAQTSAASDYFRSKNSGFWNTASNWESSPNNTNWITSTLVPDQSASAITILTGHNITLDINTTIQGLVINGGTFTASDGSVRTLTITKSSSGSATTINNNGGIWANGIGGSIVVLTGAPSSGDAIHSISGTIGFQNITINKTGGSSNVGASFGAGSTMTGTLEIGSGGYISTPPPTSFYNNSAILKFNQGLGAVYDVNSSDNSWSTSQVPQNITISSGTVNLNANRTASGNLLIDGGALVLKNANSTNLTIQGNWTRSSGTFTANDGTVTLSGAIDGTVDVTGGATMNNLVVSKTSGAKAILACNLTTPALTINSAGILTVNAGKQLTVSTSMSNSGTLNLLSDNTNGTATIITPSTITNSSASYNIQQYLGAARNWYISSPVSAATASANYTYYARNEAANSWPTVSTGTQLSVGTGYVANLAAGTSTMSFTGGVLNNGNVNVSLVRTTGVSKEGFNLVGNPYPSHITWDSNIATAANTLPTIWYRTQTSGAYAFQTYNATGGIGTPNGTTGLIPPMQAFWVRANANGATLTFTNAMRSHASSNPLKAPAKTNTNQQILRINVSNGVSDDEAVLYFDSNASNTYDAYDSPKMSNNSVSIPELYTTVSDEQLAINGMSSIPYDTEIPLGFSTGEAGAFSIKASQLLNVDAAEVYLKDNNDLLNTPVQLTSEAVYNFSSDVTNNNTSRFALIFKAPSLTTALNQATGGNVRISLNGTKQLVISGNTGEGSVAVFNSVGQKLFSENLTSGKTTLDSALKPGVYLVSLTSQGKSVTKKVIVD